MIRRGPRRFAIGATAAALAVWVVWSFSALSAWTLFAAAVTLGLVGILGALLEEGPRPRQCPHAADIEGVGVVCILDAGHDEDRHIDTTGAMWATIDLKGQVPA